MSTEKIIPFHVTDPFTLTIFGASGDLTFRKLIPGLFAMYHDGLLPDQFAIVGFARRDWNDEVFRKKMLEAVREHSRVNIDEAKLDHFISRIHYHRSDLTESEAYAAMRTRFENHEVFPSNQIFYLAIKPELFETAIQELKHADLIQPPRCSPWTRVVIEKPFGTDLETARSLNQAVLGYLDETQIYRIDHYLGKETVQNILSFRFANSIFEPLFNNHHVDHIQITAAETVGMEGGRGGYYDSAGALRDMVQNHLLQLLCLVGMEPPSNLTADSIRNAKTELLQSVKPFTETTIPERTIRAQYGPGEQGGKAVPGYLEEDRVASDSQTAAYCALKLEIANWRWAGVPIYLRTGKRLKKRVTEIAIQFKMPPLQLFRTVECEGDACDLTQTRPNTLVFRIQPDESISLQVSAKRPALQLVVENVNMHFSYADTWERSLQEAYERLLLDVMRGDPTLFTRSDEVEAAWAVVDPILKAWEDDSDLAVHPYTSGSWGPEAADTLLTKEGRSWRNPS